jgi:hypothetical protein
VARVEEGDAVKRQLDATLRQYVLGELDEERRLELEERLILEPDLFEQLGPTEDELVEDYLENVLTAKQRVAFEQHFLRNEDRRWQLGFVKLMKEHASTSVSDTAERVQLPVASPVVQRRSDDAAGDRTAEGAPPLEAAEEPRVVSWTKFARRARFFGRSQMWTGALAASLLILLAGNAWFVIRARNVGQELGRLRAGHQLEQRERQALQLRLDRLSAQAQALQTELDSERRQRELIETTGPREQFRETLLPRIQAPPLFVLATGLLRSGGSMTRIAIPTDTQLIHLRLELPVNDYPVYRAVLYNAQAEELWAQSQLTARADARRAAVTVTVPSELLSRGDYQLILSGGDRGQPPERVAAYSVRVTAP